MKNIRRQLPLLFAVTLIFAVLYITVQQVYRQGANDPQIQLAENFADQLNQGKLSPQSIAQQTPVDIGKSLTTFVVIYHSDGQPAVGTGQLNGQLPALPSGVLNYTASHDQDRVTWEPQSGVRIAAVVQHFTGQGGGEVLVGRSLREIEKRETNLMWMALAGWLITILGVVALGYLYPHNRE